ncbi:MAG: hypothetical protein K2H46_08775 [Muribaculaceae bacterium]|nr:hypothetical protein [Muribaculaceae bacterium]
MIFRKNKTTIASFLLAASLTANAFVVDWDKIRFWSGEGPNKAALIVQFDDGGEEKAYVWGYRWDDGAEPPSGEDMFRAIASNCNDLYLFTQFTGWMGNTVCGIGYSQDNAIAGYIEYDFESALEDPCISFNWFSANEMLGQTSTPGWDTPDLCEQAIEESKTTHILEHPIDAKAYGYACYDYDHWHKYGEDISLRWHAGWYKGYWSYWVGGADSESLSYSGLGYSSRKLSNGSVDAWKYTYLDGPVGGEIDGSTGASKPWHELDYSHFDNSGVDAAYRDETSNSPVFYRLDGSVVNNIETAPPGLYLKVVGNKSKKIIIH